MSVTSYQVSLRECELCFLRKDGFEKGISFGLVDKMARELLGLIAEETVHNRIRASKSSKEIQEIVTNQIIELGFQDEKKGLFVGSNVDGLRPDYYCRIGDTGVLIEIELGKTIENNNDLADLWKCHICEHARVLFLLVPKRYDTSKRTRGNIYERVRHRLGIFFKKENHINVDAVYLFGF